MITKNQKVMEELKKKQLLEEENEKGFLMDSSYLEGTKEKKSLSKNKKKKIKKKAEAPEQKKSGFWAWFTGKWKSDSSSTKEKDKKGKKTGKGKTVETAEKIVREKLNEQEMAELQKKMSAVDRDLRYRRNEGEMEEGECYEDEALLVQDFKPVMDSLSEEEGKALNDYAGGGYSDMNGYYRGTKTDVKEDKIKEAEILKDLTQKNTLSRDVSVVRHVSPENLHFILGRKKPYATVEEAYQELQQEKGSKYVLREKGFTSTTINPKGAEGFNMHRVEMRILVPKGSQGLYIDKSKYSFPGERELLLAPDTDFQLIGVKKEVANSDHHAVFEDNRNMGNTKLIMYMTVIPKNTGANQIAA